MRTNTRALRGPALARRRISMASILLGAGLWPSFAHAEPAKTNDTAEANAQATESPPGPVEPPPLPPWPTVTTTGEATTEPTTNRTEDRTRFRGGVSLGGGGAYYFDDRSNARGMSRQALGGVLATGRVGVQVDDLIGIYGLPHIGVFTGPRVVTDAYFEIGVSAVVDFTIRDRFFFGGGAGFTTQAGDSSFYGVEFVARLGGYPLVGMGRTKGRRKGLMVGVDLRHVVLLTSSSAFGPSHSRRVVVPSAILQIGYEAF